MPFSISRLTAAATLVLALGACGGPESTGPDENQTPGAATIALGNQGQATVTIGSTASVPVSVDRSGSFTGAVAIQLTDLPAGVTASALTVASGQTAGTVTLTAAATATRTPVAVSVRVSGTGAGVTIVSRTLTLTVRAP